MKYGGYTLDSQLFYTLSPLNSTCTSPVLSSDCCKQYDTNLIEQVNYTSVKLDGVFTHNFSHFRVVQVNDVSCDSKITVNSTLILS